MRKSPLAEGNCYHILNRSIAQFTIFNDQQDYHRFIEILNLYCYSEFNYSYSSFAKLFPLTQQAILAQLNKRKPLVNIIAYCIMPTHLHLFLQQLPGKGISYYMFKILNSYSKYFNIKYHRKGPLWEGRFKSILVETDEQALHLTRYIHLNPVSAGLAEHPEDWPNSSYQEYLESKEDICHFNDLFDFTSKEYKKFVADRIDYQKQISKIKKIVLEKYNS